MLAVAACLLLLVAKGRRPNSPAEASSPSAAAAGATAPGPAAIFTGTPAEVGHRHGWQHKAELKRLCETLPAPPAEVAERLAAYLPQQYVDELQAAADAAGQPYAAVLAAQCLVEAGGWGDSLALAALAPATRGDELLLGYGLDLAGGLRVVTVGFDVEGARPWVGLTLPGLHGPLAGFNRDGLALALLAAGETGELGEGPPALITARRILEECKTLPEAVQRVRETPRPSSFSLLLAASTPPAAVVLECRPDEVAERQPSGGRLTVTNHFRTLRQPPLKPDETGACERYDQVAAWLVAHSGTLDAQARPLEETGTYSAANLVWAMLEPRSRRLIVAAGEPPAAERAGLEWLWDPANGLSPAGPSP